MYRDSSINPYTGVPYRYDEPPHGIFYTGHIDINEYTSRIGFQWWAHASKFSVPDCSTPTRLRLL